MLKGFVSIIIPTFNRSNDLKRCLNSLLSQTFKDFEVLVCDDGSTDDSRDVVFSFKSKLDIKYYWLENFGGPAKARNKGIQVATGEFIAFLDSDDWWINSKLELSVNALVSGYDLVYHDMYLVKDLNQIKKWKKSKARVLTHPVLLDLLKNGNGINNSSVVVRKSVVEQVGKISEDKELIAWEDFDFWINISKFTDKFYRIDSCLGFYWHGGGNISSSKRTIAIMSIIKKRYDLLFEENNLKLGSLYPWWIEYGILANSELNLGNFLHSVLRSAFRYKKIAFLKLLVSRFFRR